MPSQPRPLVTGRGVVPLDALCEAGGLRREDVAPLVEQHVLPGLTDARRRAHGFFEDELPSREQLLELGLVPAPGYSPDLPQFRTYELTDEEDPGDADDDGSGSWSMSWPAEG